MILEVVKYGHPVLRTEGAKISAVTRELREFAQAMLDTMRAEKGIGLAAHQVGRPIQLAVIDVRGVTDRPSKLFINGQEVNVAAHMPMVLINPELKLLGPEVAGAEGCLSFPEIYAEIVRAESLDVTALDLDGRRLEFSCSGLLARVIQHETDHLRGILFIDRMSRAAKQELKEQLAALQAATKAALRNNKA
ncbi:MAG: peptide deformylase, partial [Verrucomicrobiae bacterium]|nr:peptide deformylase [Verrucomicrobiae bacterium]